jgi:hypothetical protein
MRVAITSVVVFDVPEDDLEVVKQRFEEANRWAIGRRMETLTHQPYVMVDLEQLTITRRWEH